MPTDLLTDPALLRLAVWLAEVSANATDHGHARTPGHRPDAAADLPEAPDLQDAQIRASMPSWPTP